MATTEKSAISVPTIQWVQLGVLIIGVVGFFIDLGKGSQQISQTNSELQDLKTIVQDLVKAQIHIATNDATQRIILDDLKQRVIELERRK